MPRGSKQSYTSKQRRQAKHIEESGEERGLSAKRAAALAYATVNKHDGGGKRGGSGRAATSSRGTSGSTSRGAAARGAARSKTRSKASSKAGRAAKSRRLAER